MYDNASSFGLALSDIRAERIVLGSGVKAYVEGQCLARAFAKRQDRDSTLFEVAADALQTCSVPAREHWLQRLAGLEEPDLVRLVSDVPGLSEEMRTLIPMLLQCTRDRLCGG